MVELKYTNLYKCVLKMNSPFIVLFSDKCTSTVWINMLQRENNISSLAPSVLITLVFIVHVTHPVFTVGRVQCPLPSE